MKKNKKHRHTWEADLDSCNHCGYYESYCKNCDTSAMFDLNGKKVDESS